MTRRHMPHSASYHGFRDLRIGYQKGKIMECGALCSISKSREALPLFDTIVLISYRWIQSLVVLSSLLLFIHGMRNPDLTYFMVQTAHFFCLMPDMSSCQAIALWPYEAHISNLRTKDNTQSSWTAPVQ